MNKVFIIAKREFITRARKKVFIVMTALGPLVAMCMMIVPIWLTGLTSTKYNVLVRSVNPSVIHLFPENDVIHYYSEDVQGSTVDALVQITSGDLSKAGSVEISLFSSNTVGNELLISQVKTMIARSISAGEWDLVVQPGFVKINKAATTTSKGEDVRQFMAYGGAVMVYFFIFLYGIQVMKGVVEEKTNRIVEVMICTVRPFQLMMGKIIGIMALGLTQFITWIALVWGLGSWVSDKFQLYRYSDAHITDSLTKGVDPVFAMQMNDWVTGVQSVDMFVWSLTFLFFFVMGYLLYGAMFAIIGAASDVDTDTQQFIFPLTVPLFLAIMFTPYVLSDPNSFLAHVFSIVPFTSPITSMVRAPYAVEITGYYMQLAMSMCSVMLGFVLVTWIASRVYRIGILNYGKKVGYSDLVKWFFSTK